MVRTPVIAAVVVSTRGVTASAKTVALFGLSATPVSPAAPLSTMDVTFVGGGMRISIVAFGGIVSVVEPEARFRMSMSPAASSSHHAVVMGIETGVSATEVKPSMCAWRSARAVAIRSPRGGALPLPFGFLRGGRRWLQHRRLDPWHVRRARRGERVPHMLHEMRVFLAAVHLVAAELAHVHHLWPPGVDDDGYTRHHVAVLLRHDALVDHLP